MNNRKNFLKNASLFTLGGLMAGKVGNAVAAQPATSAAFEATAAKNIGLQKVSSIDHGLLNLDCSKGMILFWKSYKKPFEKKSNGFLFFLLHLR